ncbi:MAG: CCA tRNA nucleotidyltransferase [Candidatus Aenigmarchaeota archaeon]|nr:CCA tRNA nucleotidyltransferase [Candidatus Aenigmarchaeota archaeon]
MESVLKNVLKNITPSEREREDIGRILKSVLNASESILKPQGLEKTIAGSFIRDTWLRDKKEIDLFIMFPTTYSRDRLEKTGIDLGKKIMKRLNGKFLIAYAEHPYVKGEIGDYGIDIVPCYKVESASKIKSAVDRTPFHNRYISKKLSKEMSGEVRLLKQFCKSIGVYGSDVKTQGFSGYLCELLIIKYKTFKETVKNAKNWEAGEFIDIEKHCRVADIKNYYRGQPLIIIDPTDPNRNVAAALSPRNFVLFVKMCELFVKRPSKKFFSLKKSVVKTSYLRKSFEKRGSELICVTFKRHPVVDDILFSQLRKTSKRITNFLEENDFSVIDHDVFSDGKKSAMLFEMGVWSLPGIKKLRGPPLFSKVHSKQFREKYKNEKLFVEEDFWVAFTERKWTSARDSLKEFLGKSAKKLMEDGIRSYVATAISSGFDLLGKERIFSFSGKNQDFAVFLKEYLERKV